MKIMKKVVLVLMAVCLMAALSAPLAQAGSWISPAYVNSSGAGGGSVFVMLTETKGTPVVNRVWFVANASSQNQILATALTAMSLGRPCYAHITGTAAYSTLNYLYLQE